MHTDYMSVIHHRLARMVSATLLVVLVAATATTGITTAYAAPLVFTVNSTNDANDGACDSTHCSLREAINAANVDAGKDLINFDLSGSSPYTISFSSSLPAIDYPVILDGTTQPGFAGTPIIELRCTIGCLVFKGGDSTIRGFAFTRFGTAIDLIGAGGTVDGDGRYVVEGNFIGTNMSGTAGVNTITSPTGILVSSPNNRIGGMTPETRNLISGNSRGITLYGPNAHDNIVQGNYIGTDITGTLTSSTLRNSTGIHIEWASNNTIGGAVSDARNLISGNWLGIYVSPTAQGNTIQGNFIGTDISGNIPMGNSSSGIDNMGSSTLVGGTHLGEGNVISGNGIGIKIFRDTSGTPTPTGIVIQGNYIGTNMLGTSAIGNTGNGIQLANGNGITIGGNVPEARNVISGNGQNGIHILNTSTSYLIQGNIIGADVTGITALGNGLNGIAASTSASSTPNLISENLIVYNNDDGIALTGSATSKYTLTTNRIYSNRGLGIDLGTSGVTANDQGDIDSGANNLQNYPILVGALQRADTLTIDGIFNSLANTTYNLEFFDNTLCDPSGNGEGESRVGTHTLATDNAGNGHFAVTLPTTLPAAHFITATATDPIGNTSEFSPCIAVNTLPPPPMLAAPAGNTASPVVFTWVALGVADQFQISVDADTGNIFSQWYEAADVCADSACQVSQNLDYGDYTWKVQTRNSNGDGIWSDPLSFSVGQLPDVPVAVSPSGTLTTFSPRLTWNEANGATQYRVQADGTADYNFTTVLDAADVCNAGMCQTVLSGLPAGGGYSWKVQSVNTYASSAWSNSLNFLIDFFESPGTPTLIAPNGTITSPLFNFQWNSVSGTGYYFLEVYAEGYRPYYKETFTDGNVCSAGACSAPALPYLTNGNYTWRVTASNPYGETASADMAFTLSVPPPEPPVLVSPQGTITAPSPTYIWNEVSGAEQYHLSVDNASENVYETYLWSTCDNGICSATGPELTNGNYSWKVQAYDYTGGEGAWSTPMAFTLAFPRPEASLLIAPEGTIATTSPTYTWNEAGNAESYHFSIDNASGNVYEVDILVSSPQQPPVCSTGICSTTGPALINGDYTWRVRAYNHISGYGDWSAPMAFTIAALPDAAILIDPEGMVGLHPYFTWNKVLNTTRYFLSVDGSTGNVIGEWYDASAVCSGGTCRVNISTILAEGDYVWKVRAENSLGLSPWSSEKAFNVGRFVVNTIDDLNDSVCDISHCSLREAITLANRFYGPDTIEFDIAGSGPHIIQFPERVELPAVTDAVVIDGTTEPDFSGVPVVGLSSTFVPLTACIPGCANDGLTIGASYSTVRGLAIGRFWGYGIILSGHDNVIEGNYIGVDPSGTLEWGNLETGIYVNSSANNRIGGTTPDARNVISANHRYGIYMLGSGAFGNTIQGNYVGTDPSGTGKKPNTALGILVRDGSSNVIGNLAAGARNIILGGVSITGSTATENIVQGNYLDTDVTGTARLGYSGVSIAEGASGNLIGGATDGARNIMARVSIDSGVGNLVQGNYVGTDVTGTIALGGNGIRLNSGATDNLIGGTTPGTGNVISGNTGSGVYISTSMPNGGRTPNMIVGNLIGTDVTGTLPLPNGEHGIHLDVANGNIIGGATDGAGNIIAFNKLDGVHVYMNAGVGQYNVISANSIFLNGKLGINLEPYGTIGVTPNDPDDIDTGPNGLQNFPVLAPAIVNDENTLIQGTLKSTANTTFRVELFSSTICDSSGYGEGETYIGYTDVTTDSTGDASFSITLPLIVSPGQVVTATATDHDGNTSEFSACVTAATSTIILLSPAYGSMTADDTPTFDWENVTDAAQYEIQVDNDPTFASPEVDANATSSTYTPVSALADGTYYWHVRSADGGDQWGAYSVVWTLTVAPAVPTLVSPTNGSTTVDNTPDFDWGDVDRATQYQIQVDNNSDFSSPAINTTITSSAYTPASALANGIYYWRVRAGNSIWSDYSRSWTVIVAVPPAIPTLLSPANGSTLADDNTPLFDWRDVTGATQYRIEVDDNADFSSPVISNIRSYSNHSVLDAMANGTYYWHVQASNGVWSDYSNAWTVVIAVPPVAPTLVSPTNGSTLTNATPTFDWNDVFRAVEYQIQVDDTSNFSSPEIEATVTSSTYTPTSELANAIYYWRVRANNSVWGSYSSSRTVTIAVPPPVPTLASPADGVTTTNNMPTFDWGDVIGATQYQIQVDNSDLFLSPEISITTTSSNYAPPTALDDGTYFWHVRASNGVWSSYSNTRAVTIAVPPAVPILASPADGSTTSDDTPTFEWDDVIGATQYQIQVAHDAEFTSLEIDTTTTASGYTPATALADGAYHWRVRAEAGAELWSAYSETWTVTISTDPPGVATLISPTGGEMVTDEQVTYTWTAVDGATDYQLRVKKGTTVVYLEWPSAADVCLEGTCAITLGALGNGTYKWQVLAGNQFGNSAWTSLATFVHDCPACVKPATPRLDSPAGGSTEDTAPVTYSWAEAAGVTDYQLRIQKGTTVVYQQWYSAAELCSTPPCTVTPTTLSYQTGSTYKWQVRARNAYGDSAWASLLAFTLDCPTCVKAALPVLTSPKGGASATPPVAYTWAAAAGATDYQLRVKKGTTTVYQQWYSAADGICTTESCTVTPGLVSYVGATYKWQVRAANGYQMSAWTSLAAFEAVPDLANGFKSTFNANMSGWVEYGGDWSIKNSVWLYTLGIDGYDATAAFAYVYSDGQYKVKVNWRGCVECGFGLVVRGAPLDAWAGRELVRRLPVRHRPQRQVRGLES